MELTEKEKQVVENWKNCNYVGRLYYNEETNHEIMVTRKAIYLGATPTIPKGYKRIYQSI